jgi:hypothetical protein
MIATDSRIAIADSKKLYQPGAGLSRLELGVLTVLGHLETTPKEWSTVWQRLAPDCAKQFPSVEWYRDFDCAVPIDADLAHINSSVTNFGESLAEASVELCGLRSSAILPQAFNQMIETLGNKAAALSNVTLDLVVNAVSHLPNEPIVIVCDKHGSRNSYAPFLQPRFDDRLVRVVTEGRSRSAYEVGTIKQPISISFQSQGESYLPSALASMASKYLRELAMKAFNEFWQKHVENLKPTAGYPVDAKRFKLDIAKVQKQLEISDQVLWRNR